MAEQLQPIRPVTVTPASAPQPADDARMPLIEELVPDEVTISDLAHERAGTSGAFEHRREILTWARGVVDAARSGVRHAQQLVSRAGEHWQTDVPDEGYLAEIGGELIRVADLTMFRGLRPLRGPADMTFQDLQAPTFRLFGSEPDSLIGLAGFLGPTGRDAALADLTLSAARLANADRTLAIRQAELDSEQVTLADDQLTAHLQLDEVFHRQDELLATSLDAIIGMHRRQEHERVVELLVPDSGSQDPDDRSV